MLASNNKHLSKLQIETLVTEYVTNELSADVIDSILIKNENVLVYFMINKIPHVTSLAMVTLEDYKQQLLEERFF